MQFVECGLDLVAEVFAMRDDVRVELFTHRWRPETVEVRGYEVTNRGTGRNVALDLLDHHDELVDIHR